MDKKEFKELNANEGLKGFDPEAKGSGPRLHALLSEEQLPLKKRDEYMKAKEECEKRGGNWQLERSEEHEKIAQIFKQAYKRYDNLY